MKAGAKLWNMSKFCAALSELIQDSSWLFSWFNCYTRPVVPSLVNCELIFRGWWRPHLLPRMHLCNIVKNAFMKHFLEASKQRNEKKKKSHFFISEKQLLHLVTFGSPHTWFLQTQWCYSLLNDITSVALEMSQQDLSYLKSGPLCKMAMGALLACS